jgi:hypothetical protein
MAEDLAFLAISAAYNDQQRFAYVAYSSHE